MKTRNWGKNVNSVQYFHFRCPLICVNFYLHDSMPDFVTRSSLRIGHFCPSVLPVVVGTGCLETAETFCGAAMEKYEKIKVVGRGAFG